MTATMWILIGLVAGIWVELMFIYACIHELKSAIESVVYRKNDK